MGPFRHELRSIGCDAGNRGIASIAVFAGPSTGQPGVATPGQTIPQREASVDQKRELPCVAAPLAGTGAAAASSVSTVMIRRWAISMPAFTVSTPLTVACLPLS